MSVIKEEKPHKHYTCKLPLYLIIASTLVTVVLMSTDGMAQFDVMFDSQYGLQKHDHAEHRCHLLDERHTIALHHEHDMSDETYLNSLHSKLRSAHLQATHPDHRDSLEEESHHCKTPRAHSFPLI